ncbi:unnamed protein product [Lathyrus sativus]|nr:unnamed protein product [Lathyrus sativus]
MVMESFEGSSWVVEIRGGRKGSFRRGFKKVYQLVINGNRCWEFNGLIQLAKQTAQMFKGLHEFHTWVILCRDYLVGLGNNFSFLPILSDFVGDVLALIWERMLCPFEFRYYLAS